MIRIFIYKHPQLAQLSPLLPSTPPLEFCNDENNSVIRSEMDALRNSKKISHLAVAILFLFTFGCTWYIEHRARKVARLASLRKMTRPGEFCR